MPNYYRVRDNDGAILDGTTGLRHATEALDGQTGITDPRFVNEYGYYRRIVGKPVKTILASAKRLTPDLICHGGDGRKLDDLYSVPLRVITALDAGPA